MPNIAFFDTKPYDQQFFDEANREFGFSITYFEPHLNQETAQLAEGHDVVCLFVNDSADRTTIDELFTKGVKLIALRSAGYNHVDIKAAAGRIPVVRVPEYSPYAVAEHTLGLMLCLNRKLHKAYQRIHDNNFSIDGFLGFDMHGKTVGIIGTGKIGRVLAEILKGMGMQILLNDIAPDQSFANQLGARYVDLEQLYSESDVITLHCPLTPDNQHLIDHQAISQMKEGVMLINTGRGGLINTPDLIENLKTNKIGAAGLDVYEEESHYFYEDYSSTFIADDVLARLITFPNVLITSHQAFFTREALKNIAHTTLSNIKAFAAGHKLENEVRIEGS